MKKLRIPLPKKTEAVHKDHRRYSRKRDKRGVEREIRRGSYEPLYHLDSNFLYNSYSDLTRGLLAPSFCAFSK